MNKQKNLIAELAHKHVLDGSLYDNPKVGEVILRLPEEKRKILETLTSEDMKDLRPFEYDRSKEKTRKLR